MLTAEQLELRRTKVTATDATAIVGANPYRTAHDVWLSKVEPSPVEQSERMAMGHALERPILDVVAARFGLVLSACETIVDPVHTWLCATPDALAIRGSERGVGEAKLVGLRMAHHWGDDGDAIPDYVRIQVQVQMTVTRRKRAYVGALLGSEVRTFEIEHDPDLEAAILEECEKFHRVYLVPRVPPPPDASEASRRALEAAWPRSGKAQVPLTAEYATVAREYLAASQAEKDAATRKDKAGNLLRAFIADNEGAAGFGLRATWKSTEAGGVDWKTLALELGATEQQQRQHQRSGSRRLLVKEITR